MIWNIQGLKSKIGNRAFRSAISKFQIISFTETWAINIDEFKDTFPKSFNVFTNARKMSPNAKRGSGGIITAVRKNSKILAKRLPTESENLLWVLLTFTEINLKILYCTMYYSPARSSDHSDEPLLDIFIDECVKLQLEYNVNHTMLNGDINARTSTLPDFDVTEEVQDYGNLNPIPDLPIPDRANRDKVVNDRGFQLLELCKALKMRILNGRVGKDCGIGEFTCITFNGRSVNDYVIVSESLFNLFTDFEVSNDAESDHFPLICTLNTSCVQLAKPNSDDVIEIQRLKMV